MKKYTILQGLQFIETYGFRCGNCGYPLPVEYGHSKALIKFNNIVCPNCKRIIKNVEYESKEE